MPADSLSNSSRTVRALRNANAVLSGSRSEGRKVPYDLPNGPGNLHANRDPDTMLHRSRTPRSLPELHELSDGPETHVRMVLSSVLQRPGSEDGALPYTVCQMCENHVRYETRRHCYTVAQRTAALSLPGLPHGEGNHVRHETRCVTEQVPEQCGRFRANVPHGLRGKAVCRPAMSSELRLRGTLSDGPQTTCKVIPDDAAHGAEDDVYHGAVHGQLLREAVVRYACRLVIVSVTTTRPVGIRAPGRFDLVLAA